MSSPISLAELERALNSHLLDLHSAVPSDGSIESVVVDSRDVVPGSLFLARRGESLNGHDYLEAAISAGALGALVELNWLGSEEGRRELERLRGCFPGRKFLFLPVEDATLGLGHLANFYVTRWREKSGGPVVAITGSVGKSTAKEYTAQVLKVLFGEGAYSKKSFNNHVGLPLTILSASESDSWMVVEAGMNHPGELTYLGRIAEPDISVILNVGPVHLEFFEGDIAKVADAKCELVAQTRRDGVAWINADNTAAMAGIERLRAQGGDLPRIRSFSIESDSELRASEICQTPDGYLEMKLSCCGEEARARFPQWGRHNAYNALAAVAVAHSVTTKLGKTAVKLKMIAEALAEVRGIAMRFEGKRIGKTLVINDAYNANPLSVSAAIRTAKDLAVGKSLVIVLGDMLELGPDSAKYHFQMGTEVAEVAPHALVCMGKFARDTMEGAVSGGLAKSQTLLAESHDQIIDQILATGIPDILLVKASRGMAFENVVARFEERFDDLSSPVFVSGSD